MPLGGIFPRSFNSFVAHLAPYLPAFAKRIRGKLFKGIDGGWKVIFRHFVEQFLGIFSERAHEPSPADHIRENV